MCSTHNTNMSNSTWRHHWNNAETSLCEIPSLLPAHYDHNPAAILWPVRWKGIRCTSVCCHYNVNGHILSWHHGFMYHHASYSMFLLYMWVISCLLSPDYFNYNHVVWLYFVALGFLLSPITSLLKQSEQMFASILLTTQANSGCY